jgi:hypothetical protein
MVPLLHQRPLYWTLHYSIGVLTLADLLKHLSATCTFRSHPVQAIPVLHPPGLPQLPLTSSIPLLPIPTFKSWGPFLPCSLTVCFQHCLFASLFHLVSCWISSINTIPQSLCPRSLSLRTALLYVVSFQLFWSQNCPTNAHLLSLYSFYPSTALLFTTPPGCSPGSHTSSLTFLNVHPSPTFLRSARSHPSAGPSPSAHLALH